MRVRIAEDGKIIAERDTILKSAERTRAHIESVQTKPLYPSPWAREGTKEAPTSRAEYIVEEEKRLAMFEEMAGREV